MAVEHGAKGTLAAEEHALDVHLEHPVPILFGQVGKQLLLGDPRVVDQDVYRPERRFHLLEHGFHLVLLGDIGPHSQGRIALGD